jgi:Ni/Fe-hydrogenase subunit HybB-like protein
MTNYDQLVQDLAPRKFNIWGKLWTILLLVTIAVGLYAYIQQIKYGLSITDMRDYASWGIYISNFVFFVAISLVGSLITAILMLAKVEWRTPVTRIAEIIAVAAIIMAGLTIIIDMGRPERLFNLFIHGRFQSPIMWDVIVITTYLTISILLLYYPLLPDLAILKKYFSKDKFKSKWYGKFSLSWSGTAKQKQIAAKSIRILAVIIVPVAFTIHTVTAWLFATTYRPGWDSTNFGPYFVAGAFVAGTATVIAVMYVLRKAYRLEGYLTDYHFDRMAKLLVLLILVYLYFNVNEYLVPAYKTTKAEDVHLYSLFFGEFALLFWFVIIGTMVMPVVLMIMPYFRRPRPMFIIALIVVLGAWWKRFIIVTPTLLHPFLPVQGVPETWHDYYPTWMEWAITFATLASALLIMTILIRILPIVPIHETAEERGYEEQTSKTEQP